MKNIISIPIKYVNKAWWGKLARISHMDDNF